MVRGPAGCGKTRAALAYCASYLDRYGDALRDDQRVLILSFTRAAITRLIEASPELLSPSRRSRIVINTFAGFKWDLISRFGRYLGLGVTPRLVSRFALLPGMDAHPGDVAFDGFDDQVLRLLRGSSSLSAALRARYPLLVVDEFQDTGDADWELVQILAHDGGLRCYADPNQAVGMTTVADAERRLEAAMAFGCDLQMMSASSQRDQSTGQVITAVADNLRTNSPMASDVARARRAKALTARRFDYPNVMPVAIKRLVGSIASEHRDWSVGIVALQKSRVDWLSAALYERQKTANFRLPHAVIGREDRCLGADPFLLEAWGRACGEPIPNEVILTRCGIAVAAVMDAQTLSGVSAELVAAGQGGAKPKGVARRVLDALDKAKQPSGSTASFDMVEDAVQAVDRKLFENFALPRIDVLRTRLERRVHQGNFSARQLIDWGLQLSLEEAGLGKHARSHRLQLMNIDSCKGREFDAVVIVNHPHDQFPRDADAPDYPAARAKLYTAITRARRVMAIVAPSNNPCVLLTEML